MDHLLQTLKEELKTANRARQEQDQLIQILTAENAFYQDNAHQYKRNQAALRARIQQYQIEAQQSATTLQSLRESNSSLQEQNHLQEEAIIALKSQCSSVQFQYDSILSKINQQINSLDEIDSTLSVSSVSESPGRVTKNRGREGKLSARVSAIMNRIDNQLAVGELKQLLTGV